MRRVVIARAAALVALGAAGCAGAPPEIAPPARPAPVVALASPAPTITPAAIAPPPPASSAPPPPAAPAAAAAIAWIRDTKAPGGHRSVWIEPDGERARVVHERREIVLVGADELWVLRPRKVASKACVECPDPGAPGAARGRSESTPIESPVLTSLRDGRTLEPWADAFRPRAGCADEVGEHEVTVTIDGGAGPLVFATVDTYEQPCRAPHGAYQSTPLAVDLRTGAIAKLAVPPSIAAGLARDAHAELSTGDCVLDASDPATPWRVHAEYAPDGALVGQYDYTMPAPYVCGSGPGHYTVATTRASRTLPPELAPFARLPAWVASFLAASGARHAFAVSPARLAELRAAPPRR